MNPVLVNSIESFLQTLGLPPAEISTLLHQNHISLELESGSVFLEECGGRLLLAVVKQVPDHEIMTAIIPLLREVGEQMVMTGGLQVGLKGENQIIVATQMEIDVASSPQIAASLDRILNLYAKCGVNGMSTGMGGYR